MTTPGGSNYPIIPLALTCGVVALGSYLYASARRREQSSKRVTIAGIRAPSRGRRERSALRHFQRSRREPLDHREDRMSCRGHVENALRATRAE